MSFTLPTIPVLVGSGSVCVTGSGSGAGAGVGTGVYGRGATGLNAFVLSEQYDKRKLRISYEVCKSTIYYIMQKKQISRPLLTYVTKHCLSLLKSLFLYGINTIPTKKH